MIKLYQFSSAWGVLNPSPYCMKVEVFLRLAEIPYEVVTQNDPRKAPKGKLPYIEHQGRAIPDSAAILDYLTEAFSLRLDEALSAEQRAVGFAVSKMLDEYLYWCVVYNRWIDERVWRDLRQAFFGEMPWLMRDLAGAMVRAKVRKALHLQGIGRHDPADVYARAGECLQAMEVLLGDQDYLFGTEPTSYDATLYAYAANSLLLPHDTELQQIKARTPGLLAYCGRMQSRVGG